MLFRGTDSKSFKITLKLLKVNSVNNAEVPQIRYLCCNILSCQMVNNCPDVSETRFLFSTDNYLDVHIA